MSSNIGRATLGKLNIIEEISQNRHMRCAAWRHPAIHRQIPADRVDELGPLAHRQIARAEHQPGSLLLLALHRHEAHAGALCYLADRLGIASVILAPLHKGLHVRWQNQPNLVPHRLQLACPMMRPATRFQRYHAPGLSMKNSSSSPHVSLRLKTIAPR